MNTINFSFRKSEQAPQFTKSFIWLIVLLTALFSISQASNPVPFKTKGGQWTVVASYTIPGKASGLAWDGNFVYCGMYSSPGPDNVIYKINPANGNYELLCSGIWDAAYGLTWDGQYFWTTYHPQAYQPGKAVQFDQNGNTISQFNTPATYMGGIAWEDGNFWLAAYYNPDGMIYKTDATGNVLLQFPTPATQPWDICVQDDFIWVADYDANKLFKMDKTGNLMEEHASEGNKPAGIVWDGQFLWYIDGALQANSTLYKIDLGGAGTPEIQVPVTNYDFGNVSVGDTAFWNLQINNIGTGTLTIETLQVQNAVPIFYSYPFPQSIEPGGSIEILLKYAPSEIGQLNTVATVVSDDPVYPEIDVTLTGNAVFVGPNLVLPEPNHNYGSVRLNALTRWFLKISNNGNIPLLITDIQSDNNSFEIDESIVFPTSIDVLATQNFGIWFNPESTGLINGFLSIYSNDPDHGVVSVPVYGSGLDQPHTIGELLWNYTINTSYDNSPKAILAGDDINNDGIKDIIVCSEDNYIRCFNGNSSGIADILWESLIYSGNIYWQQGLTTMPDIDNDGIREIVVGTTGGDRSIRAFSGKTGANIWVKSTNQYGTGGWVYQVDATADFNEDGINDVLACAGNDGNGTGPKRVYCLNGLNGSSLWEQSTGGACFGVIAISDITGDGKPDVLAGATNSNESEGKTYCLDGIDGQVKWTHTSASSSVWGLVQLMDINSDGVQDVAVGDFGGHIYGLSGTTGALLFSSSIGSNIILRFVKLNDMNNDGYDDFLINSSSTNCIVINGFNGQNLWLKNLADKCWNATSINDINGDGIDDVIAGTLYSNNFLYFLDGTNGNEFSSFPFPSAIDAIAAIPDIAGDTTWEMIAGGRNGEVYCYSGGTNPYVGIKENVGNKGDFQVLSIHPNPFSDFTQINIDLSHIESFTLTITDLFGNIALLINDHKALNNLCTILWNGTDKSGHKLNDGIFMVNLKSGDRSISKKLVKINH